MGGKAAAGRVFLHRPAGLWARRVMQGKGDEQIPLPICLPNAGVHTPGFLKE